MKNNRQLKNYWCFFFLLITFCVQAQTLFRAGYVIDLRNDTLVGEVDYRGDELMGKRCVFKSASGNITEYKPYNITAYRFNDDRFFVSKEINGKQVFLEFLIKGKVNIYYLRDSVADRYFIDKLGDIKVEELPFKEEIIYNDGAYLKTSNTHKSILKKYMKDATEFQPRINQLVKPEHTELIKLAKDYHNQVCKDESCIIYKKKTPPLTVDLEVVGGFIKYSVSEGTEQSTFSNFGVLAHIWLPRVNEKLYFRTGIIYSSVGFVESNKISYANVYKIPLQIEYVYPKGRIRPIFAYGFNFYDPFYYTVGFMGGLNIFLSDKMSLGLNYDIDFKPFDLPIIPARFFSNGVLVGLKIKL